MDQLSLSFQRSILIDDQHRAIYLDLLHTCVDIVRRPDVSPEGETSGS